MMQNAFQLKRTFCSNIENLHTCLTLMYIEQYIYNSNPFT